MAGRLVDASNDVTGSGRRRARARAPARTRARPFVGPLVGLLVGALVGTHAPEARAAELVRLEPNAWTLLDVPPELAGRSLAELFADALPRAGYGVRWLAFAWEPATGSYRLPAPDEALGAGASLWVIQAYDGPRSIEAPDDASDGASDGAPGSDAPVATVRAVEPDTDAADTVDTDVAAGATDDAPAASPDAAPAAARDVFAINASLGRGMNLGGALEAPFEGDWGVTLEAAYFDTVADAGFDSVRVPVRWSSHAATSPPYGIDERFFERVDWVLDQAMRTGLAVVLNLHHYDELQADPAGHEARLLALWDQIAARYRDRPDSVVFELVNEPHGAFDARPAAWNALAARTLETVRRTNPTRPVMIGPVGYNSIERLGELTLPDDPNLVASVHFYAPFGFTHQGASWLASPPPLGTRWDPAETSLGGAFRNWSWGTRVRAADGRLDVGFEHRYAAMALHRDRTTAPTRLSLGLAGTASLAVLCRVPGSSYAQVGSVDVAGPGRTDVELDLSGCGAGTEDVALQNLLENAPRFSIEEGALCDAERCDPLVVTAGDRIGESLAAAADWARARGVPLNVGEFGAVATADMASRAAWTRRVQDAARAEAASTMYWGFASTFNAWDPATRTWHAPLLNALQQR